MKKEMIEALRLTRQGRLAEAKELMQRAIGHGRGPGPMPPPFVNVLPAQPVSEDESSSPKSNMLGPGTTETGQTVPPQTAARPRTTAYWPPGRGFTLPELKSVDGLGRNILGKIGAHGPILRPVRSEMIAPVPDRWVGGVYSGAAGTRNYKLYLPSKFEGQPPPLLVMLHGCTQNPDDFAAGTRMNFLAELGGFLVVYPEQPASANSSRCWNWFRPSDQQRERGEPSLIAGISRQVMAEHHVDANRVYIAGLSAGAAMAAIMAVAYPELFAAVGVHSGLVPGSAHDLPSALQAMQQGGPQSNPLAPYPAIPLILFHGDKDSTVHPRNAEEFIRQWASSCGQREATSRHGQAPGGRSYSFTVYSDPSGQTFLEQWTVHGASHAWSGGSSNGSFTDPAGPDASREFVRFFQQQSQAIPPVGKS